MNKLKKNIMKEYQGKQILITGGTGSIGFGLLEQLIQCKPKSIRVFTNDENSIFEIKKMIKPNKIITYLMGDIRDQGRLKLALRNIDIVFHAAAMKHLDICEQNPFDAVKSNVLGTSNILEASLMEDISKFVLISTDKATNPSSTLGASKLLAERLTLNAGAYKGKGKTIFSVVRFGNVIGSRGSVFQIFLDQINQGLPVTVTDSRMTRFIMSIPQASRLILNVAKIANDGEIFILKMPSVKIQDIAKEMIKICQSSTNKNSKKSFMEILSSKKYERFHETLVTSEELPYCHELDTMYKISKKESKKKISLKQINSETAKKISINDLDKIIKNLMENNSRI